MDAIVAAAHLAPPRYSVVLATCKRRSLQMHRLPIVICFSAVVDSRLLDDGVRS